MGAQFGTSRDEFEPSSPTRSAARLGTGGWRVDDR
jgi:hypothetical protein